VSDEYPASFFREICGRTTKVPPKHLHVYDKLHGVRLQESVFLKFTALRTSERAEFDKRSVCYDVKKQNCRQIMQATLHLVRRGKR